MIMLTWLENNKIQRLEQMTCMRRQAEYHNFVLITVVDKLLGRM